MGSVSRLTGSSKPVKSKKGFLRKNSPTSQPATAPQMQQEIIRTHRAVGPKASLYRISWGLSRIEDIMKEASQSWRIPCRAKAAAMRMVPYIHRCDAIPSRLAGITPSAARRNLDSDWNRL